MALTNGITGVSSPFWRSKDRNPAILAARRRLSCVVVSTVAAAPNKQTYIEAISAMDSTDVKNVKHTPRNTQTLPAGPPLAIEEAPVLYRHQKEHGFR